jgi:uncharacterized protein (TIGR00255 family)
MTGHGAAHADADDRTVTVDVRTVNNRYFKLALRASEGYATLEPRVDELVRRAVRRGTVQVDLRVDRRASADDFRINEVVLAGYYRQLRAAGDQLELGTSLQLEPLLALPGVVEDLGARRIDTDSDWPLIESTLGAALRGLGQMRTDEGQAMTRDLEENCRLIRGQLDAVEQRSPQVLEQYRSRITERVNRLLAELDVRVEAADVIREVALFAERSDIAEEVVRLRSHLDQFHDIMRLPESSGRKLEFVSQEMFREANTIGSKANDAEIARYVIEIKAAIERVREMIQNIE